MSMIVDGPGLDPPSTSEPAARLADLAAQLQHAHTLIDQQHTYIQSLESQHSLTDTVLQSLLSSLLTENRVLVSRYDDVRQQLRAQSATLSQRVSEIQSLHQSLSSQSLSVASHRSLPSVSLHNDRTSLLAKLQAELAEGRTVVNEVTHVDSEALTRRISEIIARPQPLTKLDEDDLEERKSVDGGTVTISIRAKPRTSAAAASAIATIGSRVKSRPAPIISFKSSAAASLSPSVSQSRSPSITPRMPSVASSKSPSGASTPVSSTGTVTRPRSVSALSRTSTRSATSSTTPKLGSRPSSALSARKSPSLSPSPASTSTRPATVAAKASPLPRSPQPVSASSSTARLLSGTLSSAFNARSATTATAATTVK